MNAVNSQINEENSWEASVSCWVDGETEIRADELDTPYGRHLWDTYNLIGDVMRSTDLAIQPSERFYAKLSAAIDAEPPIVAPVTLNKKRFMRYVFPGLAVAAMVSMVWVAQPYFFNSGNDNITEPTVVLANADTIDNNESDTGLESDLDLSDYMAAHQAIAGVGPMRQVSYDVMGGMR